MKSFKYTGSFLPLKKHAFTIFFIFHFGLFHVVYFVFLLGMGTSNIDEIVSLYNFLKVTILYLVVNSFFLVLRDLMSNSPNYPNPSLVASYLRIIPIHLLIILKPITQDGIAQNAFLIFIVLKVFFDIVVYLFT